MVEALGSRMNNEAERHGWSGGSLYTFLLTKGSGMCGGGVSVEMRTGIVVVVHLAFLSRDGQPDGASSIPTEKLCSG